MYQVFDNTLPADCEHFQVFDSYFNSKFETMTEAIEYVHEWLGDYMSPGIDVLTNLVENDSLTYVYWNDSAMTIRKVD